MCGQQVEHMKISQPSRVDGWLFVCATEFGVILGGGSIVRRASQRREETMRLTVEQQAKVLAKHGVWVKEACDRCTKLLAEVRWTRKDLPEAYCSQLCRDGFIQLKGRCDGCGVELEGKRRGARWCSDACRMLKKVKDSA